MGPFFDLGQKISHGDLFDLGQNPPLNRRLWPRKVGPRKVGPGFHTTARELKRAYLTLPALQNTTKIPRKDPKREEKKKIVAGEGRKSEFWAVRRRRGGPAEGSGRGRGVRGSTQILDQTHTADTHTQHRGVRRKGEKMGKKEKQTRASTKQKLGTTRATKANR